MKLNLDKIIGDKKKTQDLFIPKIKELSLKLLKGNKLNLDNNIEIIKAISFYCQDNEKALKVFQSMNKKIEEKEFNKLFIESLKKHKNFYNPKTIKYAWYETETTKTGKVKYILIYNKLVEQLKKDHEIINFNDDFYVFKNGFYQKIYIKEISRKIKKYLVSNYRKNDITETLDLLSYDVFKRHEKINNDENIINFKNCMLKIQDKKIIEIPHNKKYLWTIQYKYNYNKNIFCNTWQNFLNEVLEKPEQRILQEMFGYSLLLNQNAKSIFILTGPTDCGKSVCLNVLSKIIGKEYISNLSLQQLTAKEQRFTTYALYGKVINVCADIGTEKLQDTGIIKSTTGGDFITCEKKHGDIFSFKPSSTLIFSCNELPKCYNDKTTSFYNRLNIIPFVNYSLPKENQDKNLLNKFNYEGIINWAIAGLERLINNNFAISTSKKSIEVKKQYQISNNSTLDFINECCVITAKGAIPTETLYNRYKTFCQDSGFSPKNKRTLINELKEIKNIEYSKHVKIDNKEYRGFKGIDFTDDIANSTDYQIFRT